MCTKQVITETNNLGSGLQLQVDKHLSTLASTRLEYGYGCDKAYYHGPDKPVSTYKKVNRRECKGQKY